MELRDIKKIVQLMKENDLTKFALEEENFKLELKRGSDVVPMMAPVAAPAQAPAAAAAPIAATDAPVVVDANEGLVEITSPMVGTFYGSPSPDSDAFVVEGSTVTTTSVVCIVEAMKVMNEIQSEVKGTIKKILVENGSPVQYGQPLFLVDPA